MFLSESQFVSLIYITRKITLEQQRSNAHSKSTKTLTPTLEHRYDAGEQHGKQDAKMSVSFESLPPVLHLHLMRYEYNAKFGAMVKLHNRHEFPLVLNLSEFVSSKEEKQETFLLHSV